MNIDNSLSKEEITIEERYEMVNSLRVQAEGIVYLTLSYAKSEVTDIT